MAASPAAALPRRRWLRDQSGSRLYGNPGSSIAGILSVHPSQLYLDHRLCNRVAVLVEPSRGPVTTMAIYRMIRQSVFEPEMIERMTAAYEHALKGLGLADRNDPITDLVARKVIEIAEMGESDPDRLCRRALEAFATGQGDRCCPTG